MTGMDIPAEPRGICSRRRPLIQRRVTRELHINHPPDLRILYCGLHIPHPTTANALSTIINARSHRILPPQNGTMASGCTKTSQAETTVWE